MKKPKYSLSIVIPTLNEINSISKTINIISKINIKRNNISNFKRINNIKHKNSFKKIKKI